MIDRETVIKGLKCCLDEYQADCAACYQQGPGFGFACREGLMWDALELLKEYKPRVLQLSEINKYDFVWCENYLMGKLYPAMVVGCLELHVSDCNSVTCHEFFVNNYIYEVTKYTPEDKYYGKSWRCWSSKPTDEQRKAVKWDD